MRRNRRIFRLAATVAIGALLWDAALPPVATAQLAPPPLPQPNQGRPDLSQGDPPARVGRIARLTGTVSFHTPGDTTWTAASVNYPVSSGTTFWTEPSSQAALEIGDSRIALAGSTEFDLTTLDASGLQAIAEQGEAYIHLRDLAPNEAWSIQTPRGLVRLNGQGRYVIAVGTSEQPTLVTVIDGAAQIDGPGLSLPITASQTATVVGNDTFTGSVGPALRDEFLTANLDAERPPPPPAVRVPAQVVGLPGGNDLLQSGSWSDAPSYGQVWYPPVPTGWVPYREGHWAYVTPWGWTWIDDAPWGFAPFHYGRWVQIGPRWAWTPGVAAPGRPIYAPALVAFIGLGAGVALGAALASRSVGWVPLGPREPFRPWYRASNSYVRQVNINHVTQINNQVTINNFVNRSAATSVPAAVMTGSQPVRGMARPVNPQDFAAARPIIGQQPLRPTASTGGVTPVTAQRMNLTPAEGFRPAPGPAIHPQTARAAGFSRPTFAAPGNPAAPANVQPGPAIRAQPGGAPPALRPVPGPMPPGSARGAPILAGPHTSPLVPQFAPQQIVPPTSHPELPHVVTPATRPLVAAPPNTAALTAGPLNPGISNPGAAQFRATSPQLPPGASPLHPGMPQVANPAVVTPTPRPEPPHFTAPPTRPEPPHFVAPAAPPRAEPQHFAAPPPQHFAAPAPQRAAAAAPPRAEAPQHQRRPGER